MSTVSRFLHVSALFLFSAARIAVAQAPPPMEPLAQLSPLPERALVPPKMPCEELAGKDFSATPVAPFQVTSAKAVTEKGRDLCRIQGSIAPTIRFQLDMPTHDYRGRYLELGCGGNCGFIPAFVTPPCVGEQIGAGGFAVGASDSGHEGQAVTWAADPQLKADFAYRAAHVTRIATEALLTAYYGAPPAHTYFAGCSDGGREAMAEAQRYPGDFEGILAGSAAFRIAEAMERFLWNADKGTGPDGKLIFTKEAAALLHNAVIEACDPLDGLKDGQIDDPRVCKYDPAKLLCNAGQTRDCLTAAQVRTAKDFYSGPVDANGIHLSWGGEPYGGELLWSNPEPGRMVAGAIIPWMIYGGHPPADMRVSDWKYSTHTLEKLAQDGAELDARNPDLKPFHNAGGKLILWQNWADSPAGPYSTLAYYQAVRDKVGGMEAARTFARVFMIPAGYHCRGGYIAYDEDLLGALVNWVEAKQAPDKVLATAKLSDGTMRTRPVFAYPERAVYSGSGDINKPDSFRGDKPSKEPDDHYNWPAARFN